MADTEQADNVCLLQHSRRDRVSGERPIVMTCPSRDLNPGTMFALVGARQELGHHPHGVAAGGQLCAESFRAPLQAADLRPEVLAGKDQPQRPGLGAYPRPVSLRTCWIVCSATGSARCAPFSSIASS